MILGKDWRIHELRRKAENIRKETMIEEVLKDIYRIDPFPGIL